MFFIIILAFCLRSSGFAASEDEFSKNLAELIHNVRPSEERQREAFQVLALLEDVLRTRWPGCKILPFGSFTYGLAMDMDLSDLDVSVMLPKHFTSSHKTLIEEIMETLKQYPDQFADFAIFEWDSDCFLNFNHIESKFNIDVGINSYTQLQISNLLKHLFYLDEKIFNVALIVKYWAKLNNKAGAHLLANHGMLVLVVFYLQQRNMLPSIASLQHDAQPYILYHWNYAFNRLDYKVENDVPLNVLVGEFFEYYSTFDFKEYFISPYVGYPIKRKDFDNLDSVPDEFALYKEYVRNGVMAPLNLTKPVLLQEMFSHNKAIMSHHSPEPTSCFMRIFNFAATKYRDNKKGFLKDILSWEAVFLVKFDEDL